MTEQMDAGQRLAKALEEIELEFTETDAEGCWRPPSYAKVDGVGGLLSALRRVLRLPQSDLAERSGLGQGDVSRIESGGDARLSTLVRLFAALEFELVIRARPLRPMREMRGERWDFGPGRRRQPRVRDV